MPRMRQNVSFDSTSSPSGAFFDTHELRTLAAACARLIPQPEREPFLGIARAIDYRVAAEQTDQWAGTVRYVDGETFRLALRGLDQLSQARLRRQFADLDPLRQDQILSSVRHGTVVGESWRGISSQRFFEELLHEVTEIYHTAPVTEEAV
jgi:gluconate 2-dehydrogenase gamma chain